MSKHVRGKKKRRKQGWSASVNRSQMLKLAIKCRAEGKPFTEFLREMSKQTSGEIKNPDGVETIYFRKTKIRQNRRERTHHG